MSTLFVDESKSKGYTMVAALVVPGDAPSLRRDVRSLVLPGQRRIHFTKESDSRRRVILSQLIDLQVTAHVFTSPTTRAARGREQCLNGLVAHAAEHAHTRIVLELDESIAHTDRRILFREVRRHGLDGTVTYALEAAHSEPLLWIADAIAWSHTKGGDWTRRIAPLISGVTTLPA
jgi:hypothetical protein